MPQSCVTISLQHTPPSDSVSSAGYTLIPAYLEITETPPPQDIIRRASDFLIAGFWANTSSQELMLHAELKTVQPVIFFPAALNFSFRSITSGSPPVCCFLAHLPHPIMKIFSWIRSCSI